MFVGEAADLIIGVATVVVSSLIYQKNRTVKGGIIALVVGASIWVVSAVFANFTILIRWYAHLFGGMETIVNMCKPVVPFITLDNFYLVYLLCCCLPFNIILAFITIIVTFVVYKHVSRIFQKDFFKK
jgi:riboflavin transporter FmnP